MFGSSHRGPPVGPSTGRRTDRGGIDNAGEESCPVWLDSGAVIGPFTYQALPMRVVFGPGSVAKLPDEVAALGLARVLVLCSPEQAETGEQVATALGERSAGVLAEARMHVPIEVATRARDLARSV